jgi:hypothetical protein
VEIEVFKKLISQSIDFDSIVLLLQSFCATLGTSVMSDRDVSNIFDMIAKWIRLMKTPVFRNKEMRSDQDQIRLVQFATQTIDIVESSTADLSASGSLVAECLDVIVVSLLSSFATRVPTKSTLMNSLTNFVETILKPLTRESIELLDSGSGDEDQDKIAIACIQIIDLLYRLNEGEFKWGQYCAECLALALSSLTEQHIAVDVCCALMEAVFVVFGESYHDDSLVQIDAAKIFTSISQYLQKQENRSDNVQGTIENIQAFIDYKRNK